ncbi:31576_t:CDS:2, partial [Racocetra persica]
MQSDIDLLKQVNIKLTARITELKPIAKEKEKVEIRIIELKQTKKLNQTENAELKAEIAKLKQDVEHESKKNRKFQEKCILITQVLLGEEPIIEYCPSFMRELKLGAFFPRHRIALEISQNFEDIVDRDWKKRCQCQLNGIYLIE